MPGGSLSKMLKDYGALEEKLIKKYARQVALGLEYLHAKGIVHRDVKVTDRICFNYDRNILADKEGNCKLVDFGAAKTFVNIQEFCSMTNSEVCNSNKG